MTWVQKTFLKVATTLVDFLFIELMSHLLNVKQMNIDIVYTKNLSAYELEEQSSVLALILGTVLILRPSSIHSKHCWQDLTRRCWGLMIPTSVHVLG